MKRFEERQRNKSKRREAPPKKGKEKNIVEK
jgi:hypothetical protein